MDARDYPVVIETLAEAEGGGFIASAPDLPGCVSDGATPAEALHNAYDAITAWLARAAEMGREAPSPSPQRRSA